MQLVHSLEIGGLEKMVVDLANGLGELGYEAQVCCMDTLGPLQHALHSGISTHLLQRRSGIDLQMV